MLSLSTDSRRRLWVDRSKQYWYRHRTLFWTLHSLWALATGVVVIVLARERYGFVPWVVAFLVLIWASTLFFGRRAAKTVPGDDPPSSLGQELTSYATRVFYQETLFFLLPFYAYSTVVGSWNVVFPALLAGLAILACLDLVFDRWLRESATFGLLFFATVAFGALNLLLPMALSFRPSAATPLASVVAVATAVPLAARNRERGLGAWLRLVAGGAILLVVGIGFPQLVPPAPLRLEEATFAAGVDRSTLEPLGTVDRAASTDALRGEIAVIARVFAPSKLPARVALDWYRDGALLRSSREVRIIAHAAGFRVWDILGAEGGIFEPGDYRVILRTADGRVFGDARIRLRREGAEGTSPRR